MDNVQINKIQKCTAPSSISFRCIFLLVVVAKNSDNNARYPENIMTIARPFSVTSTPI
jgi:hypothetical protein